MEDLDGVRVGVVVQDVAQEVDVSLDGLRREEVMRLEGDLALELSGEGRLEGGLQRGEVLNNEFQGGEFLGDGDGAVAYGAAHLERGC